MAGRAYTKEEQLGSSRKRYRRKVASRKTWEKLRDERLGACVMCMAAGIPQAEPSTLHHVVSRAQGGSDVPENLVSLCGSGTSGHHGAVEGRLGNARQVFAEAIQANEPAVYAYAVEKLGEAGWLRAYGVRFECVVDESAGQADA